MQDRVKNYATAAKDLFSSVAKLAVTQATEQFGSHQLVQTSSSPSARAPVPLESRVSRFKQQLLASRIDLHELRRLSMQGIPDKDGLRAITWKLLLGYLPPNPDEWDETLARRRTQYLMFCQDLIVDPKKAKQQQRQQQEQEQLQASSSSPAGAQQQQQQQQQTAGEPPDPLAGPTASTSAAAAVATTNGGPPGEASSSSSNGQPLGPLSASSSSPAMQQHTAAAAVDDPLSSSSCGVGGAGSASSPALLQAEVPEDHPLSLTATSKWHTFFKDNEIMEQIDRDVMRTHPDMHFFSGPTAEAEGHRTEMKRALFMYAKLNPGLRYIQGMNELLAPLYYMFSTDSDRTSAKYAEADAFYCFVDLISEFRDHFCQQLDNSNSGIKATIGRLMVLLEATDPELAAHLVANKVDPQFYSFRWITLLLTQEFPFPDAVRIWDTLLADPRGRLDCLLRVCLALLMHVRKQLLEGDFAANVKLLQRYPSVDVSEILAAAERLPPCKDVLGVAI